MPLVAASRASGRSASFSGSRAISSLSGASPQKIADLGQQDFFTRWLDRLRDCGWLLPFHPVDRSDDEEQDQRDDQEIDRQRDEMAVGDGGARGPRLLQRWLRRTS